MALSCNNNSVKSHQGTVKTLSSNLVFLPIELGMNCESREPLKSFRVSKNLQGFFGVDNLYLYRHSECFCLKCGLCSNILHRQSGLTQQKGCVTFANEGHSRYCEWPSLVRITQPCYNINSLLITHSMHRPCLVLPCGHLFCEPCLRRAKINECSTCKTKIDDCKLHQGMYLLYQTPLLNRPSSFIKFDLNTDSRFFDPSLPLILDSPQFNDP